MKASPVQKLGPHASVEFQGIYKAFTTVFPKNLVSTADHVYPEAPITTHENNKESRKATKKQHCTYEAKV
jgi:hypothetical protein